MLVPALVGSAGAARADATSEAKPAAAPAEAEPHVVLIQESNGFPGAERSSPMVRQEVAVVGGKLRMIDAAHRWALFVDLDRRTVQEGDAAAKEYVERSFDAYQKFREQREKNLASQKAEYLRTKERLEDDGKALRQWIATYRRAGGDPEQPGRIVARLQHYAQDTKTVPLWVDGEERRVTLEHYVIRENHADVPVFDLWITRDVTLPVDLLRFYGELGTFSEPVSQRLLEVPGTIIGCTAVLDTGSLKKTFRTRITEIRTQEPPRGSMTVPDDWTRVEETEQEAAGEQAVTCAVCNKQVPREKAITFREPWGARRTHTLCSNEHRRELVRRLAAERR